VLSSNYFYCQENKALFHNQETAPLRMRQTELRSLGKIGAEIAVISCFPGTISTARVPQHCSIIRNLHLCECARLRSRFLGNIDAEIAVLSWKNFFCQGTTALFHNKETGPLRMRQTELSLSWQDKC
jgi:hypothetical protein